MESIQDISKSYDVYSKEAEKVEEEYNKKIDEAETKVELLCKKYKDNAYFNSKQRNFLNKCNKQNFENIREEENEKTLFNKYFWSYIDACFVIRNSMVKEEMWNLIFSYLFNLCHLIELNIKTLKVKNINGFENVKSNHELLKMYKDKKQEILNLGLDEKYYDILIAELTDLGNLVSEKDMAMCFKYPLGKDFETIIINDNLRKIKPDEIVVLLEKHKKLLMIIMCIKLLSQTSNYKKSINELNDFIIKFEEIELEIEKELNS